MKRIFIIIIAVLLCCLFLLGCSNYYDADDVEQIREEAFEAGYQKGYQDAEESCGSLVYNDISNAGIKDAEEIASDIETKVDAPEDFSDEEMSQSLSGITQIREVLRNIHELMDDYKTGID